MMSIPTVITMFIEMELSHYFIERYRDRTDDERTYWRIMRDFVKGEFYSNASEEVKAKLIPQTKEAK